LTVRLIYDNYDNHKKALGKNYMKGKTFTSLRTLILAAGSLLIVVSAQATLVDLTTGSDASGEIDGALFFATQQQPSGTGFIDPFLRIDEKSPTERGYNTDGGFPFDDKNPHNFQHSLYLPDMGATLFNGIPYLVFELDSNQAGTSYTQHDITMTALQIFTTNDPSQTTTTIVPAPTASDPTGGILQLNGTLVYNLGNNSVKMTAQGSGKQDMFMYIPLSLVQTGDLYLVLYSVFNNTVATTGGFEEWIFIGGPVPIPEMGTFFPVIGLLAAVLSTRVLRRRKIAQLARQQITLS
jgi:hypothetical protein